MMQSKNENRLEKNSLFIFIGLFPFSYALQVIFCNLAFGLIPYFFLLLNILINKEIYRDPLCISNKEGLDRIVTQGFFYLFLSILLSSILFINKNQAISIRALVIYGMPFLLLHSIKKKDINYIFLILRIISLSGLLIGTELLYEDFGVYFEQKLEGTFFQKLNYNYVLKTSHQKLTRLYAPEYRPTGLIEHVHATVLFLATSSIYSLTIFLKNNKFIYLLTFFFCSILLLLHGVRTVSILYIVGLIVFYSLFSYNKIKAATNKFFLIFGSYSGILVSLFILDPFKTVHKYYIGAVTKGDFNIPDNLSVLDIYTYEMNNFFNTDEGLLLLGKDFSWESFFHILFGLGPAYFLSGGAGGSDDAYFIQFILQNGLVGTSVLLGIIFYFVYIVLEKNTKNRDIILIRISTLTLLFMYIASTIHSPALARKSIFTLFIIFICIFITSLGKEKTAKKNVL